MNQVTQEQFYAHMGPLNVHPRNLKAETIWEMQDGSRRVVGRSTPGWDCTGPRAYFLVTQPNG